jgi:hypothetical protein
MTVQQTILVAAEVMRCGIKRRFVQISAEVKAKFSCDIKFLCEAQGVHVPFLPVSIAQEYILFTMLIRQMHGFDADSMAILWMEHVNGVTIFPKLPVYLQEYYKHWQRNQRIQDAIKNMKSEKDFLDELNKRHVPAELLVATTTTTTELPMNVATPALQVDDSAGLDLDGDDAMSASEGNGGPDIALLNWQRASTPPMMPVPMPCALLAPGNSVYVGMELIGAHGFDISTLTAGILRTNAPGQRGIDAMQRRRRHCSQCRDNNGCNAESCKGRGGRRHCEYFDPQGAALL